MSKLIEKVSGLTIILLGLVSVVLVVLIYVGGNAESITVADEALTVPKYTDPLLFWSYFLLFLTIGITLLLTIIAFIKQIVTSPLDGLKTLIPIGLFIVIFVVAWMLGNGDRISIIGYEGTENEGFWAHFTDMIIYSCYALFIGVMLTIGGSAIYKKLK